MAEKKETEINKFKEKEQVNARLDEIDLNFNKELEQFLYDNPKKGLDLISNINSGDPKKIFNRDLMKIGMKAMGFDKFVEKDKDGNKVININNLTEHRKNDPLVKIAHKIIDDVLKKHEIE